MIWKWYRTDVLIWEYTDSIADLLEDKIEKLEKYQSELFTIGTHAKQGNYEIGDILEDLELTLEDICDEFRNCTVCPLRKICEFATKGCNEAYNCEDCPRLRVCLEKGILEINTMKEV